jgi:L-seryl-tRNA(Ser) seleniumtransferase
LRTGDPAVLPRVHGGSCLLDLRCVPEGDDDRILDAVRHALATLDRADAGRAG